jgi:hypothetical protein
MQILPGREAAPLRNPKLGLIVSFSHEERDALSRLTPPTTLAGSSAATAVWRAGRGPCAKVTVMGAAESAVIYGSL